MLSAWKLRPDDRKGALIFNWDYFDKVAECCMIVELACAKVFKGDIFVFNP